MLLYMKVLNCRCVIYMLIFYSAICRTGQELQRERDTLYCGQERRIRKGVFICCSRNETTLTCKLAQFANWVQVKAVCSVLWVKLLFSRIITRPLTIKMLLAALNLKTMPTRILVWFPSHHGCSSAISWPQSVNTV